MVGGSDASAGLSRRPEGRGPYVAVIGAGRASAQEVAEAETLGAGLARVGTVVVCGGLGGVMEGVCRGASAEGGTTVGILPGFDRGAANAWVDVAIPTGLGEARNALVVRSADAVIAIGGEFGTLSEIALAVKTGRPVIGIGTWELSRAGVVEQSIVRARDAAHALELLGDELGRRRT